jgi:hypothetical protein
VTVYLTKSPGVITLQARAEGQGAIGDLARDLRPGESAFGKTYEQWAKLPEGAHETDGHSRHPRGR